MAKTSFESSKSTCVVVLNLFAAYMEPVFIFNNYEAFSIPKICYELLVVVPNVSKLTTIKVCRCYY